VYSRLEHSSLNSVAGPPQPIGAGTQRLLMMVSRREAPRVESRRFSIPSVFLDGVAICVFCLVVMLSVVCTAFNTLDVCCM